MDNKKIVISDVDAGEFQLGGVVEISISGDGKFHILHERLDLAWENLQKQLTFITEFSLSEGKSTGQVPKCFVCGYDFKERKELRITAGRNNAIVNLCVETRCTSKVNELTQRPQVM